jgi:hypothetical protein
MSSAAVSETKGRFDMTRVIRLVLVTIAVCAMSAPAFAIHCFECDDLGNCVSSPDSGTRCHFTIDTCETVSAPLCTGVADQDTLASTLTIASVDVVTPAGVTTSAPQRLAERRPAPKLSTASPYTR